VFLRITVDGKRAGIVTKIFGSVEKWKMVRGRQIGNTEETKRINKVFENFEPKAIEIYNWLLLSETASFVEFVKEMGKGCAK
jgi:hypothetical protein